MFELTIAYSENTAIQKGEFYRLLAMLYREPKEDLFAYVQSLSEIPGTTDESIRRICEKINHLFEEEYQDLEEYMIEYSRLFVGPFKLVAPPFSSIYLEDKWEIMGRSTQVVESYYERAGLAIEPLNNQPSDHISTQLEFMYYLNFKWNETKNLVFLELQKEFLYKILTHWIPKFNAAIQQGSSLKFYKYLGTITELFIQQDYTSIK